ncbi:FAD:protein FMN transferase [Vibrio neonatus]|uniref:FAD:protein FMN transferase n=1 Tax=Vibrio neonatus TaxID=278860 RepID=UPI0021C3E42E|nr:FAD:protein FMN transferase [Vibrio neonatus]
MACYSTRFELMGTFIDLIVHHEKGEHLIKEVFLQLNQYAQRFTVNQDDSELMKVNQFAGIKPVTVQPDLFYLIKKATQVSLDMSNPFNIAVGPLVKMWRIGFKDAKLPTDNEITRALELVNPKNIILNEQNQSVFLSQVGMRIDLGAIAKGYFADEIKRYLVNAGVTQGIINLGGNVLSIGGAPKNANQSWNIGIQNPLLQRGEICRVVPLKDRSMVTSGINERFFQLNGKRYHHLLDPNTGRPISTDIASVTIISERSIDGEIWSTAGFLSSTKQSLEHFNQLSSQAGIEAVIISQKGDINVSKGLIDDGQHIMLR